MKKRTIPKYCLVCKFKRRGKNHNKGEHHQKVARATKASQLRTQGRLLARAWHKATCKQPSSVKTTWRKPEESHNDGFDEYIDVSIKNYTGYDGFRDFVVDSALKVWYIDMVY